MVYKRYAKLLLLVIIAMGVFGVTHIVKADKDTTSGIQKYKNELKSQSDGANSAPREGNNPSDQAQTSLASVASKPAGNGQQVDIPAADVMGSHDHHVQPAEVLPDVKKTGIASNGCSVKYVASGDTCTTRFKEGPSIPVYEAGVSVITCATGTVATINLQGIKIENSSNALASKSMCNQNASQIHLLVTSSAVPTKIL